MKKKIELKEKEKANKGITLIALVITIIVLLILAAVSIATLTGENGILTKASTAKKETEIATEDEKVRLAVAASIDNNGNFDLTLLPDELKKYELNGENNNNNVIVDTEYKTYTIDDKGKITEENKTTTGEEVNKEIIPVPETYVKSFNAGKNGQDNVIGYIVKNAEDSNAYDMIFIGTGEMFDSFNSLNEELSDYVYFTCSSTWYKEFINIKISYGITTVPGYAFSGSKTLKQVILPSTIESIGWCAFYGDTSVKEITIPASVKLVGYQAFFGWNSDQTINIIGSTDGWENRWDLSCDANIVYKNQ